MSNFWNRNKKQNEEVRSTIEEWVNPILGTLSLTSSNSYTANKALKLSTVYRAVNVISDSVAILPIDNFLYKDNWKYKQYNNLYYLLNVQPNPFMSAFTLKKMIVQYLLLNGNAYIAIQRTQKGEITQLVLLDSTKVRVIVANGNVTYEYNGGTVYDKEDIIHIMNYSTDGITGISTISYASMTLGTAYASEEHASNFFSRGANMAGLLRPIAGVTLNDGKAKKAKDAFINALSSDLGGASNSIVVLDSGLEYQPITLSPKDSQLLESRAFNIITIAQFFGVSPHKLFDFSKGSYNSVEASQIDFLNSTIQPLLEKIELELYRKIFTRVEYDLTELKFDVSNLLRMDSTAQANYFTQMHNIGAYTTNEVREKINANAPVKGGNRSFVQVNLQPIDNLISEQPAPSDASGQIDNKLKNAA
jgi:HK97 family phage portal protein